MSRKFFALLLFMFLLGLPLGTATAPGEIDEDQGNENGPWYEHWLNDQDHSGIDDRIEELMVMDPETPIPIFVDYDHRPGEEDIAAIKDLGYSVDYVSSLIDTVIVLDILPEHITLFRELPGVVMVELNPPMEWFLDISTPGTKSRDSDEYSPNSAWDEGYTGEDIVIAVLDTGADDGHESLDGKFVAGVDVSNPGVRVDGNPDDGHGHGSHCSGTAMGDGGMTDDNNDGEPDYMGTAPDALLVDVKVSSDLGGNIGGPLIEGMDWCVENKDTHDIRVLSISLGTGGNSDGQDATSRAANEAVDAGLILVVAAGNDGPDNDGLGAPAAADKVITVGAVDDDGTITRDDDTIAGYSSRGPRDDDGDDDQMDELKPDVVAPGSSIYSVQHASVGQNSVGYRNMTGTSMACPHVAGIVALMLDANPNLTPDQVKSILRDTAEQRGEVYDSELDDKYSKDYGWGIVDAYKAVVKAAGGFIKELNCDIDNPIEDETVSGTVDITGTSSVNSGAIEKVEVKFDDGDWEEATGTTDWSFSWDTSTVDDGEHTIYAWAYDGEEYSSQDTVAVVVDNSGGGGGERPIASITSISPKPAEEGDVVTFVGSGEDDGDIQIYVWKSDLDGELYNDSSDTYKTNTLSVGTHAIRFLVQDDEGLWSSEVTDELEVTETPNEAPEIELDIPHDGAVIEKDYVTLYWTADDEDDDDLLFDVYLDTTSGEEALVAEGIEDEYYLAEYLVDGETYYWKVIVSDGREETESEILSFEVKLPDEENTPVIELLFPADESSQIQNSVTLTWEGSDEDGDDLSYTLYFSTETDPQVDLLFDSPDEAYTVEDLEDGTTYYWKVSVSDGDLESESDVWQFTVELPKKEDSDDEFLPGFQLFSVLFSLAAAGLLVNRRRRL